MVTLMCVLLIFLLSPERGVLGCKQEFTRQRRLGRITATLKKQNSPDMKSSRRGRQAENVEAEEEKCNTRKDPRWFAKAFFVNIQLFDCFNVFIYHIYLTSVCCQANNTMLMLVVHTLVKQFHTYIQNRRRVLT